MRAVGALDEVYSCKNIFMEHLAESAGEIYASYHAARKRKDIALQKQKKNNDLFRDTYSFWANITRATHLKYKVFSSKTWKTSVFDADSMEAYRVLSQEYLENYRNMILSMAADDQMRHDLAWLEHRRWNAFLRTQGFTCPSDSKAFFDRYAARKNLDLRQHLCLVECSRYRLRNEKQTAENAKNRTCHVILDKLDEVSALCAKGTEICDLKIYDDPENDLTV